MRLVSVRLGKLCTWSARAASELEPADAVPPLLGAVAVRLRALSELATHWLPLYASTSPDEGELTSTSASCVRFGVLCTWSARAASPLEPAAAVPRSAGEAELNPSAESAAATH